MTKKITTTKSAVEKRGSPVLIIKDLKTLRVITQPLRFQILEILSHEPKTVRQVARELGFKASKLYYHFGLLEKSKLIKVVETHIVSGIIEKRYQARAQEFDISRHLLSFTNARGKQNIGSVITTTLDSTRNDFLRSLEARAISLEQGVEKIPRRAIIQRVLNRIPDDKAEEFISRLQALVKDFKESKLSEGQTYAFTLIFYPSFFYEEKTA